MIKLANNLTNLASKQADWGSTMAGLGTFAKEMFNPAGAMNMANILPPAMMHGIQR